MTSLTYFQLHVQTCYFCFYFVTLNHRHVYYVSFSLLRQFYYVSFSFSFSHTDVMVHETLR